MLSSVQQIYDELWKTIVRPPRDEYSMDELGESRFRLLDGRVYMREDFDVVNGSNETLRCSHYEPLDRFGLEKLPCVVYLHGNSSSRVEACGVLPYTLPLGITVVCFDFSGSGHSDGDWVTLGWKEKNDLDCVVQYLKQNRRVATIGLWGRSMGAVTALLYNQEDHEDVTAIVADSPFSNLRDLIQELAAHILYNQPIEDDDPQLAGPPLLCGPPGTVQLNAEETAAEELGSSSRLTNESKQIATALSDGVGLGPPTTLPGSSSACSSSVAAAAPHYPGPDDGMDIMAACSPWGTWGWGWIKTPVMYVCNAITTVVLGMIRSTILSRCDGFDIHDLHIDISKCNAPLLFVNAKGDYFIKQHHPTKLFNEYRQNKKWFINCNGDHNSERSPQVMYSIAVYLYHSLQSHVSLGGPHVNVCEPHVNVFGSDGMLHLVSKAV
ncbi:alpha/beta hydrolase family protein [Gregarina niphandrodes]|uniref:Alpha/beta hydrolase family protein n=1 Tax=Gregarina niphandrodes TaxID=110365 RepID=A0A023B3R1_GRENI|nr:alpha/beta hydrolase family protein [Gregarina niphandrodes]EZG55758.1 alpha/beta hydrolase family protein [Gregarina niphandrodes]|eukprot:XP_011131447.1 alpha/beta hydrolase family protein [Gregarina niphandrodes]